MFSVSPEIYNALFLGSRYLFVFFALMILLFAFLWLHAEHRRQRDRVRSLPEVGTIGEMIVISGNEDLPSDTWFPVPREGVLGSLRSCDLVVPCSGVRSRHLDFSWQDGTGLLLRPRSGCQALVNGVLLDRKTDPSAFPLVHGSFLQVGDAVLRLQLFSALNHTNVPCPVSEQAVVPAVPAVPAEGYLSSFPLVSPVQDPSTCPCPPLVSPAAPQVAAESETTLPDGTPVPNSPAQVPVDSSPAPASAPARRKRADRWKEDWSE